MDLTYTAEQRAFREELRAWLAENVPRTPLPSPGTRDGFEAHRAWEGKLYEAGYGGLSWPPEYGGRGADVVAQAIFEEEYLLAGAPERISVVGQKLMGPVLMAHGTDAQRRRWLPDILSGEAIWSQGFSETEAGSDLANVRMRAERRDDAYVVNGQKIWTSYGAFADWIFLLVRTDPDVPRKHQGLTFLACEMSTPGLEARPIVQIDGHAGFAEVFCTDVRVPQENVIGEEGDGWRVALTCLAAEREAPARPAGRYRRDIAELVAMLTDAGRTDDGAVRDDVTKLFVRAEAYRTYALRTLSRLASGEELGSEASVTKLLWSELERDVFEQGLSLLGDETGGDEAWWTKYWYARAATIYAGTSEIQRNIVAERLLGLPRD